MKIIKKIAIALLLLNPCYGIAQMLWQNVDMLYQPLPAGIHVYKSIDTIDGKPNIAFYVSTVLADKQLKYDVDTTTNRRLTPLQYFNKNNQPVVVVNCTFFEFKYSKNLNTVIKNEKQLAYTNNVIYGRGKDTFTYKHTFGSAIGISKKRKADVAWLYTDSSLRYAYASQKVIDAFKDSAATNSLTDVKNYLSNMIPHAKPVISYTKLSKWKMQTAVGGGPVLLQNGEQQITNNEEIKFAGKAIADKHPRTAMGYTADGRLIILVIQGRFANVAEGASLTQEATILKNLGCVEALNLDGGGSSCLLINGKETIKPSDKEGQRPVPAVFMVQLKK